MGFDEIETFSPTRLYTDSWTENVPLTTHIITYTSLYEPWPVTYNPCTPYLSIPPQILTIDPLWNTCVRNFRGLHDPPSILDSSNGFLPVRTATAASETSTEPNSASAGHTIQQPVASKTPAPEIRPTPSHKDDPLLAAQSQPISKLPAVVTFGRSTVTEDAASKFVIDGQTLAPGGKITVSKSVLSMATDGHALIIDSSSVILDPSYLIGTQTLSPGGPDVTIGDTVMSLEPGSGGRGESVIVNKSVTVDVSMLTATGTSGGGGTTSSVAGGGINAGEGGLGVGSGSGKISIDCWIAWQVALSVIISISAFV